MPCAYLMWSFLGHFTFVPHAVFVPMMFPVTLDVLSLYHTFQVQNFFAAFRILLKWSLLILMEKCTDCPGNIMNYSLCSQGGKKWWSIIHHLFRFVYRCLFIKQLCMKKIDLRKKKLETYSKCVHNHFSILYISEKWNNMSKNWTVV